MRPASSPSTGSSAGDATRDCSLSRGRNPAHGGAFGRRCYTRGVGLRTRSWPHWTGRAASLARGIAAVWPLTPSGAAVGLAALWALTEGRRRLDLVLSLAGAWGLVLVGLCGLLAGVSGFGTWLRLRHATSGPAGSLAGAAGERLASGLEIRPLRLPLVDEPTRRWIAPPAAAASPASGEPREPEVVIPEARDLADEIVRELRVGDVLGLWSFRLVARQDREVVVHPARGRLLEAELAACLAPGDAVAHPFGRPVGDRVDSRPYVRSDPARLILWKAYARSRELLVRTPEPARAPDARPLVFLATGPDDEAAAAAARLVWQTGLAGRGARLACDGFPAPTEDLDAGLRAIAASSRHRARSGRDLAVALASREIAPDDPVLVVLPAVAEETIGHVLHVLGTAGGVRFSVLGALDTPPRRAAEPAWRRLLLRARPEDRADGPRLADAEASLAPLAGAGARVVLADRRTGAVRVVAGGLGESPVPTASTA